MATALASVDAKAVVRCDRCLLVQFAPINNICRRCRQSLDEEPEIAAAPTRATVLRINGHGHGDGGLNLPATIRSVRLRNGWSQRQLALRMSVPRTYVSKMENDKATPTLSTLERLAKALKVKVPDLLFCGERSRQEALRELTDDGFVRQVLPFVGRLSRVQMTTILARVADLTVEQSRCRIVR